MSIDIKKLFSLLVLLALVLGSTDEFIYVKNQFFSFVSETTTFPFDLILEVLFIVPVAIVLISALVWILKSLKTCFIKKD
ncbi:hypothetical protein [Clostridium sp. HBUAS56017]|uniref:hypothetical protein n=1 Tax=Clostridium sp. HBUAS56017 TaxID=2571128 RepID=UPI001177FDA5|nr:hypothetical protein [Clostridium sp. HBUAS56017]